MTKILILITLSFALNTVAVANAFDENKRDCDLNDGAGCFNLGVLYANGMGVKLDTPLL